MHLLYTANIAISSRLGRCQIRIRGTTNGPAEAQGTNVSYILGVGLEFEPRLSSCSRAELYTNQLPILVTSIWDLIAAGMVNIALLLLGIFRIRPC